MEPQTPELASCDYPTLILHYGGKNKLIRDCLSYIDEAIWSLTDEEVTAERLSKHRLFFGLLAPGLTCFRLQSILVEQNLDSAPLHNSCGYVDFITDSRSPYYLRFYVGQSDNLVFRWYDHCMNILRGSYHTLHYFVLQLGKGFRTANLLRLWTIPGCENKDCTTLHTATQALRKNFLEMLLCGSFHALSPDYLKKFFGHSSHNLAEFTDVGLNVLSPLLQGLQGVQEHRGWFREKLRKSKDKEIRLWPTERARQIRHQPYNKRLGRSVDIKSLEPTTLESHVQAFQDLCRNYSPNLDPTSTLQIFQSTSAYRSGDLREFSLNTAKHKLFPAHSNQPIQPIGNLEHAKIGIIVDHASLDFDKSSGGFPASFAPLGLHHDNSLIWTYNHTQFGLLAANSPRTPSQKACDDYTALLIQHMNLKVILLCGELSEKSVIPQYERLQSLSEPHNICLRGQTMTIWLNHGDESKHPESVQAFIRTPEVFALGLLRNLSRILLVGEIFSFVSFLTSIPLQCHFYEASTVYSRIFVQRRRERDNPQAEKMTLNNLDPVIRHFLWRKGFRLDADISSLETAAGGLTTGVCMLLFFLKRNVTMETTMKRGPKLTPPRDRSKGGAFDKAKLDAVGHLWAAVRATFQDDLAHLKERRQKNIDLPLRKEAIGDASIDDDLLENKTCVVASDNNGNAKYAEAIALDGCADPQPDADGVQKFVDMMQESGLFNEEVESMKISEIVESMQVPGGNSLHDLHLDIDDIEAAVDTCFTRARFDQVRQELLSPAGREYHLPTNSNSRRVRLSYNIDLIIPSDFVGSTVKIAFNLVSSGNEHPHRYYQALVDETDPALQLGIQCSGKNLEGEKLFHWISYTESRKKYLFRLNTFIDRLRGDVFSVIALRRRRGYRVYFSTGEERSVWKYSSPYD
jgi:hypothetical protein